MNKLFSRNRTLQNDKLIVVFFIFCTFYLTACGASLKRSPGSTEDPKCPASAKQKLWVDQSRSNPAKIKWVAMPPGNYFAEKFVHPKNIDGHIKTKRIKFKLKGFEVSKSEITVAQYRRCVKAKGCWRGHYKKKYPKCYDFKKKKWVIDTCPMVGLPMTRIIEFAKWAKARPISRIEWEYTFSSGGCKQLYPWGNKPINCSYANVAQKQKFLDLETNQYVKIKHKKCKAKANTRTAVCLYRKGHNAQGVCDLVGNVRERVGDVAADIEKLPRDGTPFIIFSSKYKEKSALQNWKKQFPKLKDLSYRYIMKHFSPTQLSEFIRFTRFFAKGSLHYDDDARESLATMTKIYFDILTLKYEDLNKDLGFRLVRSLSKQKNKRKR